MLLWRAASTVRRINSRIARMGRPVEVRDPFVAPVDRHRILHQIVGADAEKIHQRSKPVRQDRRGGVSIITPSGRWETNSSFSRRSCSWSSPTSCLTSFTSRILLTIGSITRKLPYTPARSNARSWVEKMSRAHADRAGCRAAPETDSARSPGKYWC